MQYVRVRCGDLLKLKPVLERVVASQASMTSAIRWKKRLNAIFQALIDYERKRHSLVMTHGRPLPGQKNKISVSPVMIVDGKEEKDLNWIYYTEALNKLNDSEIELEMQLIPLSDLEDGTKNVSCPSCGADMGIKPTMTIEELMLLSSFVEG